MSYKIIAVVGPTAVGKSDVGVRLAQLFDGEIINDTLIEIAKRHGGHDNITATVIY